MKSERRHELQHNALADWLVKSATAVKPYQNSALIVVVAILVVVLGYTWWSNRVTFETTQAWEEMTTLMDTGNVKKLATVIEDYPNTTAAQMAAVVLADYRLGEGCNQLFVNKATAQEELNKAIKLYDTVRQESRMPMLQERATFGLARTKEAKGEADAIKQAEQLYKEVATKWPQGVYAVAATQRLEDLKRPATKRFYDDFRNFDPKPTFTDPLGQPPTFDMNSLPSSGPVATPESSLDLKLDDNILDQVKKEASENKPPEDTGKK